MIILVSDGLYMEEQRNMSTLLECFYYLLGDNNRIIVELTLLLILDCIDELVC